MTGQRLGSISSIENQSPQQPSLNVLNGTERKSLIKCLTGAMLSPPFALSEHWHLQPVPLAELLPVKQVPMVVRDDEWGSVVAYALCTEEYDRKRRETADRWPADRSWPTRTSLDAVCKFHNV